MPTACRLCARAAGHRRSAGFHRCYPASVSNLSRKLAASCRRFGVASLYAFGSRAAEVAARVAGEQRPGAGEDADVDIGVQPVGAALRESGSRVALAQALETLFGVSRVDLVIITEASPFLAADAVRGELLYCDDEDRQAREELYYLRRVADLAPFQRARLAGILSGELRR